MKKREMLIFSIFGFLLALTRLTEGIIYHSFVSIGIEIEQVQKNNKALADQLYQQMNVLSQCNNIMAVVFKVLTALFLLYIGWKIAYGLLNLRYIIIGTFGVFILSSLVQFAFQPKNWSVWIFSSQNIIYAAVWIAVMKIYRFAWEKMQLKDK